MGIGGSGGISGGGGGGGAAEEGLSNHLADTADAHDASAVSFSPTGTIAATDVQAAIAEVASEAGATTPVLAITTYSRSTPLNITAEGTLDYLKVPGGSTGGTVLLEPMFEQGFGTSAFVRKKTGGRQLNVQFYNRVSATVFTQSGDTNMTWTDNLYGGAGLSGNDSGRWGIWHANQMNFGFVIYAKACKTERILRIMLTGFASLLRVTAHLDDASIADVVDTSQGSAAGAYSPSYAVNYKAAHDGANLVCVVETTSNGGNGNIMLCGLTLANA